VYGDDVNETRWKIDGAKASIAGGNSVKDTFTIGASSVTIAAASATVADEYSIGGSRATINSGSAKDTWTFTVKTSGVQINDKGGDDTFEVGKEAVDLKITTSAVNINKYTFSSAVAGLTINDAGGDDVYTFEGVVTDGTGRTTITDAAGADKYVFKAQASADIVNTAGNDSITLEGAAASDISLNGAAFYIESKNNGAVINANSADSITAKLSASANITGTAKGDQFTVTGGDVTLNGAGADSVWAEGKATVSASGLTGTASFYISGAQTVYGGTGNDSFYLAAGAQGAEISGGGGSDILVLGGQNKVTIKGSSFAGVNIAAGNDKNTVVGSNAGAALNWVIASNSNEIATTAKNDKVTVSGSNNTVRGSNGTEEVTLASGADNLTLKVFTGGTDKLTLEGESQTVILSSGVTGTFEFDQAGITVKTDDGFSGTSATVTVNAKGDNFTYIGGKSGALTLNVDGANANITGGKNGAADVYNLNAKPAAITGGTGADIYNINTKMDIAIEHGEAGARIKVDDAATGSKVTGPSKAAIYTVLADSATIAAGAGDDFLAVSGNSASINGGAGKDSISLFGDKATVNAGDGNDSIQVGTGNTANLTLGTGKDTVELAKGAVATISDLVAGEDQINFYTSGGAATVAAAAKAVDDGNGGVVVTFYQDKVDGTELATVVSSKSLNEIKEVKANSGAKTINALLGVDSMPATDTNAVISTSSTLKKIDLSKFNGGQTGYAYVDASGNLHLDKDTVPTDEVGAVTTPYVYIADANARPTLPIDASGADKAWRIVGTTGKETITGSNNGDTINGNGGGDSIIAGTGSDYITASNGDYINIAADGHDTVDVTKAAANSKVTVAGFDPSYDVFKVGDVTQAVALTNQSGELEVTNANGDKVTISNGAVNNDGYWAHLTDGVNTDKYMGWADKGNAGHLNGSGRSENLVVDGRTNDLSNTLEGGKGKDTVYGTTGDSLFGAEGNDNLVLVAGNGQREVVGITKGINTDTVTGFTTGFEAESDQVAFLLEARNDGNAKISGNDVIVSDGDGRLVLEGAAADGKSYFMINDKNGENRKVAVGGAGTTLTASNGSYADIYIGESGLGTGTTVDFSNNDRALALDLGNTGKYDKWATPIVFGSISNVKGADNQRNTIVGSEFFDNSIVGGMNGHNSLYGGGRSNDVLKGQDNSEDYFFFGTGQGHDSIQGFTVGDNSQSDKVVIFEGVVTGAYRRIQDNKDVTDLTWSDGNLLTIEKAAGSSDSLAASAVDDLINYGVYGSSDERFIKIGYADTINTFAYDARVNEYYGNSDDRAIGNNDILTVGAEVTNARIYLGGSSPDGQVKTFYRGITNIDARGSKGNLELCGGELADSIVGGMGANSLWGGNDKADDTLVGGSGKNEFFFAQGQGHDLIMNSSALDKVVIYNTNLDQCVGAQVTDEGNFIATMADGSSLTITNIQNGFKASFTDKTVTYNNGKFA
jgi:hypothetical protein